MSRIDESNRDQPLGGLLVLLGMAALIAAPIVAPKFGPPILRGRTKRTMADVRAIATAVEAYSVDHGVYPPTGGDPLNDLAVRFGKVEAPAVPVEAIAPMLFPKYIHDLPIVDPWGRPYLVATDRERAYAIGSAASDGEFEQAEKIGESWRSGWGYGADVVFENGQFTRY